MSLLGRHSSEHDLAQLRSNNSWGDGSVIRRRLNEDLRTNWDVVIKIDNVIVGQRMQPDETFWPIVHGSLVPWGGGAD